MTLSASASSYNPVAFVGQLFASRTASSSASDLVHDFLVNARLSSADRLRASALKDLGLTEDVLQRMKSKVRRQTDAAINDRIEEKAEQSRGLTGVFLDLSVE